MGVVVGIVFMLILLLFVVGVVARQLGRAEQRSQQHARCHYCRARLKRAVGGASFATTCSKCGRTQPWAAEKS